MLVAFIKRYFNNKQTWLWWFILILALAAFLLFFHIQSRTLWMDEAAVLEYIGQSPAHFLGNYFSVPDNHPPLFYLLVLIVNKVLPNVELGIRLVSILASLGIVALTYFFSLLLFENRKIALWTMFLTGWSSYFLLIGQMARYHTLAGFFSLLALYYLIKLLKKGYSVVLWWLFLGAVALVGWIDYLHFFYLLGLINLVAIIWAISRQKFFISWWRWFLGQVIVLLSFGPMVWLIYARIVYQGDSGFGQTGVLGNSIWQWLLSFLMHWYAFFFGENIFPWNYLVFGPGLIIGVFLLINLVKLLKPGLVKAQSVWLLLILLLASVLANVVLLNLFNPRYNFIVYPKYVFVAYPLFILLITRLLFFSSKKYLTWLIVSGYIIIQATGIYYFYQRTNYLNASYFNDFSGFQFVQQQSRAGDRLILSTDLSQGTYQFYQQKYFKNVTPVSLADYYPLARASAAQRFWFFATGSDEGNKNNEPDSKIPKNLKIIKAFYGAPLDTTLKQIKEKILHRPSYNYKYGVFLLQGK